MPQCHDIYRDLDRGSTPGRSVVGTQCHDEAEPQDDSPDRGSGPSAEQVLAGVVHDWAARVAPGDERTAADGAAYAVYAYASGASVPEACEAARRRVYSRLRHPSHVCDRAALVKAH